MNRWLSVGVVSGFSIALLVSATAGQASGGPPVEPLRRVQRGEPLEPCPEPSRKEGVIVRESRGSNSTVDSCGRIVSDAGELLSFHPRYGPQGNLAPSASVTIDRMTIRPSSWSHTAAGGIVLVGSADVYELSDGSQWSSGAGTYFLYYAQLDHVEVSGTSLRYVLSVPAGLIYEQTDYDSGNHSAQGKLAPSGTLVLETEVGSTKAVLRGNALLVSNDATSYGEPRFNYYTAVVGSVVPFELTYTIQGSTWTADAFNRPFTYSVAGFVDFEHPVSVPRITGLSITGPSRIPDEFTTTYLARALYESGVERNVSSSAAWTVDPDTLASVTGGVLTTGTLPTAEALLTLRAELVQGADHLTAEKQIRCLADDPVEKPGTWPMFQANARHTGYIGNSIDPGTLHLQWQRNLGPYVLNPVAAGDGKVFVTLVTYFNDIPSLFALSALDGTTLWSKGFGDIFSVNPPSYAYGNVYVQTGNHGTETWLRALDGETGDTVFQAPHAAQWERYFAPTIYEGKAYINGGYYGGAYAFDAYTGAELWFVGLPQYDQWTPAVDAGRVYEYVGEYSPGLYAQARPTGASALFISDPAFDWNGWSMGLAPVLGSYDDVIAIHDGRLISFDTALGTIRWEVASQFAGQPSVAQGRIYAIDGGRLRVLDEITHAEIWSWQPPNGNLAGPMIVTDTHVLASTGNSVHVVDLVSQQSVWSYPVGGHLAIADGLLYVASANGVLSAFSVSIASSFYTISPCRVVDTRDPNGVPVGGPALAGGVTRVLTVAGHCGVPATARAVAANITVVDPGAQGHVSVGKIGEVMPVFSTLNYSLGQTRANNAILELDQLGNLAVLPVQATGTTVHLIIDVNGYFE